MSYTKLNVYINPVYLIIEICEAAVLYIIFNNKHKFVLYTKTEYDMFYYYYTLFVLLNIYH